MAVTLQSEWKKKEKRKRMKDKKKEKRKENLVSELWNFLLESLHHFGQSVNFMSLVMVNGTLWADGLPVCVAVGVDFQVWMFFTTNHPQHRDTTSWLRGLIKRDKLMVCHWLGPEVWLLAIATEGDEAIFAEFSGLLLFTAFTNHMVRIHKALINNR